MEEFDDLVERPNDSGELDMSHRAWKILEDSVWEWGTKLFVLNISYNNISEIPAAIEKLKFLRELNCSSNAITVIPPEIGNCHKLKLLKANGNRLKEIPKEIEGCRILEEIVLSENEMRILPDSIGTLAALSVLKLQNNQLKVLNPHVCGCISLVDIDVTNNPLENIPEGYFTDTKLILWICTLQRDNDKHVNDLEIANSDLEDHMRQEEEENINLRTEMTGQKREIKRLLDERPEMYLKIVNGIVSVLAPTVDVHLENDFSPFLPYLT